MGGCFGMERGRRGQTIESGNGHMLIATYPVPLREIALSFCKRGKNQSSWRGRGELNTEHRFILT